MMSGTMTEIGCESETPVRNHLPTALAISFAVFVAAVVIGLTFLIIYKKVKAEDDNTKVMSQSGQKARDGHSLQPLCHKHEEAHINENGSVVFVNGRKFDETSKLEQCAFTVTSEITTQSPNDHVNG